MHYLLIQEKIMNSRKIHTRKWENLGISDDLKRLENDYPLVKFFQNILIGCQCYL